MRVGIIALLHESNTFVSGRTTLEHFQAEMLLEGDPIRERLAAAPHETGGFFAGLAAAGIDAVPIFAARALPSGTLTAGTMQRLMQRLFDAVARAGKLDGYLAAPHGATVSESIPDVDGHWLTRLRDFAGPHVPIVATLDPHANLSAAMVDACDAIVAYRTNPHLDQRERGLEAARLMARALRGEVRPVTAAVMPPIAINIAAQGTQESPCRELYALADAQLRRPGVLSNSILLGFPYADVPEMGSATLAVTDGDRSGARALAMELARYLWEHRQGFAGRLIGIEEALDQAAEWDGPICLLDMGDNVGGGSAADGTWLAHALHRRPLGSAFVCLFDPEAVDRCAAAGVGTRLPLRVGGKTDGQHGPPLEAEFEVLSLQDGRFCETEARHGGFTSFDQGRTAIVRTARGLTVMLTSRRMVPFSLKQLTSCGLDPAAFHILVAKGVNAPRAAYAPVCKHLLRVNTPGSTCADMTQLAFQHRRRPMFPFERDATFTAE